MARTFSRVPCRHATLQRWLSLESLEDRSLPSFVTAPTFTVGVNTTGFFAQSSHPIAVAVGDFNGDGKMDVVTANEDGPGVSLLLGKGNGKFQPCSNFAAGTKPSNIIAVDVNGDGRLDVVVTNGGNNTISYLRGNGDGTFKAAKTYSTGAKPDAVACADFNGDGKNDLVVANHDGGSLTLLFATATGGFTSAGTIAVGTNPTSVVAKDFNNDGKPDLASVSGGFDHLDVNLNQGNGTFTAAVNYVTGFVANTVVVGNFNGDSQPDLAIACKFPSGDGVSILLGNADGTFQTFQNYDAGGQTPLSLAVADLNSDGIQDLVTANQQFANNSVSVLLGTGTGAFGAAQVYAAGQGPTGVAVADFNSDGVPDVVATNHDGDVGSFSLLRGNSDGSLRAAPDVVLKGAGPVDSMDWTGDGIPDLEVATSNTDFDGVTIFPGTGIGTFGAPIQSPTITGASALVVRDINNDQKPDLIVASGNGVTVILGGGNGTFGTRFDAAAGTHPMWVIVDDFNGDNKLDLAVANDGGVSLLLGDGNGNFGSATTVAAGGAATYLESGDFNGDGKRDLAVIHNVVGNASVSVLLGHGDATFGAPKSHSVKDGPGSVGVGDFNRDGKPDLAVPTLFGSGGNSAVAILRNTGGGLFTAGGQLATDSRPIQVLVRDLTGDGKLDLAVVNNFGDTLSLFAGRGDGTFNPPKHYVVGDRPSWVTSADFNSDGLPDLAVVNDNAGTITLLQTPAPATHFRVNVVPDTTTAGAAVTVVVSALDSQGRLATNFAGTVHFTSSDARALLPANYTFTGAEFGVKKFTVTLKTAGTQSISVTSGGLTGSDSVAVTAANANHFKLTTVASTTAGAAFNLTVTALDAFNNVATGYRGTVHLTSTVAGAALPPDYTFQAADNGAKTFSITLDKAGLQTVNVKDKVKLTLVKSASLTVVHDVVAGFSLSGYPTKTSANVAHTFTVTAVDAFGNTVTDYLGTIHFSVAGGTAKLPPDFTFTATNKGRHTASATFLTSGAGQSLTATDINDPTLTGTESGITVT